MKKYTFDDVKLVFEERGYTLLERTYEGQLQKLSFKCPSHSDKETIITFKQLKRGEGCKYCGIEKYSKFLSETKRKYDIESVRKMFEENGCELLETEYKNDKQNLEYKCKCGKLSKTSFSNYRRGNGLCKSCGGKNKPLKWSYEEASKIFEEKGCKLLPGQEIHTLRKLSYICSCGNISTAKLSNFIRGQGCKECAENKRRLNYSDVKSFFENEGCTLKSTEYRDTTRQKLDYICKCGNPHSIRFQAFKRGDRCPYCRMVSKGEKTIDQYLRTHNLEYKFQYVDPRCKNKAQMTFDFAIFEQGKLRCLIEYDGRLHFVPVKLFGGEDYLSTIKENDEVKNQFCKDMNIPLHRIPYKQFKNIETILDNILRHDPDSVY